MARFACTAVSRDDIAVRRAAKGPVATDESRETGCFHAAIFPNGTESEPYSPSDGPAAEARKAET